MSDIEPTDEAYRAHVVNVQTSLTKMMQAMEARGWPPGAILEGLVLFTLNAMVNSIGPGDTCRRLAGIAEGLERDQHFLRTLQ